MAEPKDAKSMLANRSASGNSPVPKITVIDLPAKLKAIDPDGCEKWKQQQQQALDQWVEKLNVVNAGIVSQIPT